MKNGLLCRILEKNFFCVKKSVQKLFFTKMNFLLQRFTSTLFAQKKKLFSLFLVRSLGCPFERIGAYIPETYTEVISLDKGIHKFQILQTRYHTHNKNFFFETTIQTFVQKLFRLVRNTTPS